MFASATLTALHSGAAGAWWELRILTATAIQIASYSIPLRARQRYGIWTTTCTSGARQGPLLGPGGASSRLERPLAALQKVPSALVVNGGTRRPPGARKLLQKKS